MASMDLQQANVTLLSENENLKHDNDHLNKVLNLVQGSLEPMTKNDASSWDVLMDLEGKTLYSSVITAENQ